MTVSDRWKERARRALSWTRARAREPAAWVFCAAFAVLVGMFSCNSDYGGDPHTPRGDGTYRPVLARGDGHMIFLMTRSMVMDRDLIFDNDLARFGDPWRQPRTATGRKMIPHPIGPALVQAPLLAVAHGMSKVANALGADIPEHGYTMFHQRVVFFASVLFAFATALLGYVLARRLLAVRWAPLYAAVAILFGTSLTYYATYMPSYAHAMDAFACAGFVTYWALTVGDMRWRRFAILGLLLGLVALVRVSGFCFGMAVAVELGARACTRLPDDTRGPAARARFIGQLLARGLLALVVAICVFSPQLLAWKLIFGDWLVSPMGPEFMRLEHPHILSVLFSSRNGWLASHPLAYAGLLGLVFAPRRARLVALGLLPVVLGVVWINGAADDWWAGASFGNRRLCGLSIVLILGLACLVRACNLAARRVPIALRHGLAILVLGWFLAWNMAQVLALDSGKPPNSRRRPCCAYMPGFFQRVAQPVYDQVGNPFAWPASALFAWRHDVPIERWDLAVGHWPDRPALADLNKGTYRRRAYRWNLPGAGFAPWIVAGLGPPQKSGRHAFRWTVAERARVLVPLWLPDERIVEILVVPNIAPGDPPMNVRVAFNGTTHLERELSAGEHRLRFEVPRDGLHVGMNEMTFEAAIAPHGTDARPAPPDGVPVGLALHPIELRFPRPAP